MNKKKITKKNKTMNNKKKKIKMKNQKLNQHIFINSSTKPRVTWIIKQNKKKNAITKHGETGKAL